MALKVMLVDDEALARMRLRDLLADCADPATELVAEAANAQVMPDRSGQSTLSQRRRTSSSRSVQHGHDGSVGVPA